MILEWDAGGAVQSYTLERSIDQSNWTLVTSDITTNSYSDSATDFGVHYYYRLSAVDAAGTASGYALADIVTPNFSANTNGDNSSTFTSDDGVVTVTMPSGAVSNTADCSIPANTTKVTPTSGLKVVVGPYQLICKDETGNTISSFLQPLAWSINVKGKLSGVSSPQAYNADDNGKVTAIQGAAYSGSDNLVKFSSTSSNAVVVLGKPKAGFPWNLLAIALLLVGAVLGIGTLILRRSRAIGYNDYLRQKYYNL